jgi:hypothetical protein
VLPWLVAVLLVLNLGLFGWGQRHEVPNDPKLPPLPAAAYPIKPLDRAGEGDARGTPAAPPADDTLTQAPATAMDLGETPAATPNGIERL